MIGPLEDEWPDARSPSRPARRERLETAYRNHPAVLMKLVNTCLDFSRIEAGRVQARLWKRSIVDNIHRGELAAASARPSSRKARPLTLTVDRAAPAERRYIDKDMWEKIVLNLLSNAFKHTFDGGIRTTLMVWRLRGIRWPTRVVGITEARVPRCF